MEMPTVKMCDATSCSFNKNEACHALAVTIGDIHAAACDTFVELGTQGGELREIAGVGACKKEDCAHNEGLYCTAPSIQVHDTADGPMCSTYSPSRQPARVT